MAEQSQKVKDAEDRVALSAQVKSQMEDKFAMEMRAKENAIYELRSEKKELIFQVDTQEKRIVMLQED